MSKSRVEAFGDGVIAIGALEPLLPVFLTCGLSFVYVGTCWNNHHYLLHAAERINARFSGPTSICCSGCR